MRCEDIHRHRLFIDPARPKISVVLKENEATFNGVVEGEVERNGDCEGTSYVDHQDQTHDRDYVHYETKMSIKKGSATINLDDKKLILENGNQSCFDPTHGHIFWSVGITADYCDQQKPMFLIYKGQVNKTIEYKEDN